MAQTRAQSPELRAHSTNVSSLPSSYSTNAGQLSEAEERRSRSEPRSFPLTDSVRHKGFTVETGPRWHTELMLTRNGKLKTERTCREIISDIHIIEIKYTEKKIIEKVNFHSCFPILHCNQILAKIVLFILMNDKNNPESVDIEY